MSGLLADVVRATASAPDAHALLDRVARLLLARADWVLADRLDAPDLVVRVAVHARSGRLELPEALGVASARRSSAGSVGLLPVLRRAPGRVLRLSAARLEQLAGVDDVHLALQARTALALGGAELLLLGLVAHDELVGVLTLGRHAPLDDDDVAELTDVALHVGLALGAARLLRVNRAVATAMQTSLLPPVPVVPGLQLAARYSPAPTGLAVGGDWYDAFPTPAGDGLVVVVGDVRGHDLPAAARMADSRNLLRAYAVDRDEPPSALLTRLDRAGTALGLDLAATLVVGRLSPADAGAWRLVWSNAGHLPPLLLSAGRARLLETEPDLMLGVEHDTHRSDSAVVLLPGDTLVLCTDGLVERRDQPLDERLDLLAATARRCASASPDVLAEQLLGLAQGAGDDVALLVVRVSEAD